MAEILKPTREGDLTFSHGAPFRLEAGGALQPVSVRYAVYGELNERRDNAVLVCHALSGAAHVAEWWPEMFADPSRANAAPDGSSPGGIFDLARDCVICTNILGSCYGSSGPTSINPATGKPFGPDFPLVTIRDMVRAEARVLEELGVKRVRTVIGPSIGGMQALQWAVDFPERVEHCIALGCSPLSALGLGLNHLQRQAIELDPAFREGRYAAGEQPARGLGLARAIGMVSYKSPELFDERYGRKPNRNGEDPVRAIGERYDVAGYLDHQGEKFVKRFDANSYLVITKAMDTWDLGRGYASEAEALKRIQAHVSLVGISSDWLFPPRDVREMAKRIEAAGAKCDYSEFETAHGHDGFLAEMDAVAALVKGSSHARRLSVVPSHPARRVGG
ncbi:MAG TPA: homoserine O-acetyltransferase [Candidatus Angelobacter sp.]|jgi:homoserine O-acetyltransferase|nr:homoserine O-acetyltransferase [Candidatus Angelobacter sp.]